MHISRVRIENFRNFRQLDVKLGEHAVVVGENKVGKTNFLHALRLVLDPSLPDSVRQLRPEDIWDGVARPIPEGTRILVAIDLAGFDDNDEQLASLADFLVEPDPMVARLTYEFRRATSEEKEEFEFIVYGGNREEARVTYEVRKRLALEVVHALRDAEGDLASWRRSPLRPLLTKVADTIDPKKKQKLVEGVSAATDAIVALDQVDELGELVSNTLESLVGSAQAADVELGLVPTDADRLLRSLRLLIDDGLRGVGEASLGVANTLYLTLKLLELNQLAKDGYRDHTFLAIEEPEAHLHPHLQRNVFRSLLRGRTYVPKKPKDAELPSTTILLTTHSPHVTSVAPLRSLVLLRSSPKGTTAVSTAGLQLEPQEEEDLERYLDVTRAEMLFARGVLLVEGDAEVFVIPKLAALAKIDLDSLGITVCSVGGVNFAPYVKLLKKLAIPFAVVTDFDADGEGGSLGENRVVSLMKHLMPAREYTPADPKKVLAVAPAHGVFLGGSTFEIDLLRAGRGAEMCNALIVSAPSNKARKRAEEWLAARQVPEEDEELFLTDIEAVGKGRFAQRLAATMKAKPQGADEGPKYVLAALDYLTKLCPAR